jgi:hypothetical protein
MGAKPLRGGTQEVQIKKYEVRSRRFSWSMAAVPNHEKSPWQQLLADSARFVLRLSHAMWN